MKYASQYIKTLLVISGLSLTLLASQIWANEDSESKPLNSKMQHRIERLIEKLELSENQVEEFKAAMQVKAEIRASKRDQKHKIRELLDGGYVNEAAETAATFEKQNIYAISEHKQRIAAILTDEQLTQLDSMHKDKRDKGKHCRKHKRSSQAQTATE